MPGKRGIGLNSAKPKDTYVKTFHASKEKEAHEFAKKHGYIVKKHVYPKSANNSQPHEFQVHKNEQGVAEGSIDTVYPNATVIKSKNGKPVGEIYQDSDGTWGAFHYRADRGADGMDSREDAMEELRFIHSETGRSGPDYTLKGVAEEQLEETTPEAIAKIEQLTRK